MMIDLFSMLQHLNNIQQITYHCERVSYIKSVINKNNCDVINYQANTNSFSRFEKI